MLDYRGRLLLLCLICPCVCSNMPSPSISFCQRWNPIGGFSDHLLPSDRWQWSDITGLKHQPLDSFELPSSSWDWEGDWYVDENFEGEPTEKEVSVQLLLKISFHLLLILI